MTYYASIVHHSISRAHVIIINGSLKTAKARASREFGDGFLDHEIIITDAADNTVASRRIADRKWTHWF